MIHLRALPSKPKIKADTLALKLAREAVRADLANDNTEDRHAIRHRRSRLFQSTGELQE